jgi:hypothetical protein
MVVVSYLVVIVDVERARCTVEHMVGVVALEEVLRKVGVAIS